MWALPATKEAPKGDEGEESRVAHSCFFFVFRPPVFTPLFLHTPASDPAEHRGQRAERWPHWRRPGLHLFLAFSTHGLYYVRLGTHATRLERPF